MADKPDPLAFLLKAMELVPRIIQAGMDMKPFAEMIYVSLRSGAQPTNDDWDQLRILEDDLRDVLGAPLPDEIVSDPVPTLKDQLP